MLTTSKFALPMMILSCLLISDGWAQSASDGFSGRIQRGLDQLKEEPTVREAQGAALRFFNIDPSAVTGMRNRAALKGLMPSLEARYRHSSSQMDAETQNVLVDESSFLFDDVTGTANEVQVGLRWNLPQLIFNAEVLDVNSLAVLQEGVLKEVTRIYYTRRRLQIDLVLNPPTDPGTELSKNLRIEELESTLDAMTGNLFSNWRASMGSADDDFGSTVRPVRSSRVAGVRAAPREVLSKVSPVAESEVKLPAHRSCFSGCRAHQERGVAPMWVSEAAKGAGAQAYASCRQNRPATDRSTCVEKELLACTRSCDAGR